MALFPGAPRRLAVTGATVSAVIDGLDDQVPGIRNRLVDAGPILRTHLNVYVDGARSGLDDDVAADAVVHIIPAVSGG